MKIFKVLTLFNSMCVLAGLAFYMYNSNDQPEEIIYVNDAKLYNAFDMTKETNLQISNTLKAASREIDSLVSTYQNLDDKMSETAKQMQNQIVIKNRALQERQDSFYKASTAQITQRLQDYLKAYALKMNYRMVIGSNVLYSDALMDKTEEALLFVNQKYNGLNPWMHKLLKRIIWG